MISRRIAVLGLAVAILTLALPFAAFAQTATGSLRGQVADPSGAVVTQATITITGPNGQTATAAPTKQGTYDFKNLVPGKYTLKAVAPGFNDFQLTDVIVPAGASQQLDISFEIAVQQEKVVVEDQTNGVDTSSSNNANTTIIQGKDLDALSDDPDELQSDLQALAGPSAGPNGGQIYIDGFTNGQLPPKASIREIRVNQNPFSAQYDRLGYGRVEVFTKPGMDKYHGQLQFQESNSFLNAPSPFGPKNRPDYHTEQFSGNFSGPLNKKSSFFLNAERRNINDNALMYVKDHPDLTSALEAPKRRTNVSPRLDYQLTPNNTLTMRYQYVDNTNKNSGIGQQNLPSLATNTENSSHLVQLSDTQVLSTRMINETRFQFNRDNSQSRAVHDEPFVSVQGLFNTGGNYTPRSQDVNDQFEIQNYTSLALNKHFVRFGGRVRTSNQTSTSLSNFNGAFTYETLAAFDATTKALQAGIKDIATILAAGGGASQYTKTSGRESTSVSYVDAGLYLEDDWRLRSNVTLSYGVRYETQNNISDHGDFAPRVGIAWGLGNSKSGPKTVLRAGYGIFYDRVGQSLTLQSNRFSGVDPQQRVTINCSAAFPCIPDASGLLGVTSLPSDPSIRESKYTFDPNVRAPYTMQVAVSLERQLGNLGKASLTYLNSRGLHLLASRVLPLQEDAVTYNNFEYISEGIFKQNQLIANANVRAGSKLSLFGFYSLSYANGDTNGAGSIATDPNNLLADYGRAAFDVRHRLFIGGSFTAPFGLRLSPFIIANSGMPFNIVLPYDANGDSVFNDRPTLATQASTDFITSKYGNFDLQRVPNHTIAPVNYGQADATYTINLRVSRTFGFGPKLEKGGVNQAGGGPGGPGGHGGGGRGPGGFFGGMGGMFGPGTTDRKYSLTLGASARNLLNHTNAATPVSTVGSPMFGQSTGLAGGPFSEGSASNRRVEMQLTLGF